MKLLNYKTSLLIFLTISSVALTACKPTEDTKTVTPQVNCTTLGSEVDNLKQEAKKACKDKKDTVECTNEVNKVNDKIREYNKNGCTPKLEEVTKDQMAA
ncbi:hypothetical protein [Candidatus Liberibacter americanus]|uniref:Lipoprotein n=1 Tax=Candidatus Liberibacter americanus str. Sao Paulo TaxID=1261131 RepID=U6B9A2_9HYPH|nr:hypothetical protein [Candidatus Liberibacter americanus]AHA28297.1 hypothetical protein lam_967 [Candidatus Liberibacter americanus str. Sao Paulo]EMS36589.1 hypothetical protein G653_00040 [Candidatus Liberibacter americanus PW_SP]